MLHILRVINIIFILLMPHSMPYKTHNNYYFHLFVLFLHNVLQLMQANSVPKTVRLRFFLVFEIIINQFYMSLSFQTNYVQLKAVYLLFLFQTNYVQLKAEYLLFLFQTNYVQLKAVYLLFLFQTNYVQLKAVYLLFLFWSHLS